MHFLYVLCIFIFIFLFLDCKFFIFINSFIFFIKFVGFRVNYILKKYFSAIMTDETEKMSLMQILN